jgi:hypothetical protein
MAGDRDLIAKVALITLDIDLNYTRALVHFLVDLYEVVRFTG